MGDKIKDVFIGGIMAVLAGLGTIFPVPFPFVLRFVVLFSILFHGQVLGKKLFARNSPFISAFAGTLLFLALQSLVQTAWFYLGFSLDTGSDSWCLLISMALTHGLNTLLEDGVTDDAQTSVPASRSQRILSIIALATGASLLVSILFPAWKAGTFASLRTPWPLMPVGTLAAIACLWSLGLVTRLWKFHALVSSALESFALAATTFITPLIYRIGFGFDGFLHIASEQVLLTTGFLQPKPFYYIGQYVFTTWLARFAELPLASIDRWLVPVSAALLFSFCLFLLRPYQKLGAFFPLALFPIGACIATTPQSFAYVIGISALILSLGTGREKLSAFVPGILALWAIAIHPLAGIPFFLVSGAICIQRRISSETRLPKVQTAFAILHAIAAGLVVPCLFFILSLRQGTAQHWDFTRLFQLQTWSNLWQHLLPNFTNYFVLFPAWSTLISSCLALLLLLIALVSLRSSSNDERWTTILLLISSLSLFVSNAVLASIGDFGFLIDYERGNYADRLFLLGTLFALFAAASGFRRLGERLRTASPVIIGIAVLGYGAIGAALAYDSLPRHDALVIGRGWSVGRADIEAVRFIDRDARGSAYGVLANQSVSAAAVSQLGFKRYAKDDVFFYPIPTGGPLYQEYLRLTYREPTLDPIQDAAQLTQSQKMYVVVNDYWWQSEQLNEALRGIAQDHWSFGDPAGGLGSVVEVYRFDLKTTSN